MSISICMTEDPDTLGGVHERLIGSPSTNTIESLCRRTIGSTPEAVRLKAAASALPSAERVMVLAALNGGSAKDTAAVYHVPMGLEVKDDFQDPVYQ